MQNSKYKHHMAGNCSYHPPTIIFQLLNKCHTKQNKKSIKNKQIM